MGNPHRFRVAVDIGGTFTDAVVVRDDGILRPAKAPTTPERTWDGMRTALELAAASFNLSLGDLLDRTTVFFWGTTRATNAILEGTAARTAFSDVNTCASSCPM